MMEPLAPGQIKIKTNQRRNDVIIEPQIVIKTKLIWDAQCKILSGCDSNVSLLTVLLYLFLSAERLRLGSYNYKKVKSIICLQAKHFDFSNNI